MNGSFALLAVCIAAAGFVVSTHALRFRYKVARESGHRLYLTVITLGVVCCFAATVLIAIPMGLVYLLGGSIPGSVFTFLLGFATFCIGCGGAEYDNRRDPSGGLTALWKAWEEDDLELVCATAQSAFKPISVTLDTGKVYVGLTKINLEAMP